MIRLHAMTHPVKYAADPATPVLDLLKQLERTGISGAPVVDDAGNMVGFASQSGINMSVLRGGKRPVLTEEVMTPFVFALRPDLDLRQALHIMIEARIHRVLTVNAENCPLGVMTTLDVVRGFLQMVRRPERGWHNLKSVATRRIGSLMTKEVETVRSDDTLATFLWRSERKMFSGAPVVLPGTGDVVGVISQRDISRFINSSDKSLHQARVRDAMTQMVHTCSPDDDLLSALEKMAQHEIHRLVVLNNGRMVGIFSGLDVVAQFHESLQPVERILMSA